MGWAEQKRDELVLSALLHDLHESVTGDILPMFKTPEVKEELQRLQEIILENLGVATDNSTDKVTKFLKDLGLI